MSSRAALLMAFGIAFAAACDPGLGSSDDTVSGVVTFRSDVVLPPEAQLLVALGDMSLPDAPAEVMAEDTIGPIPSSPVSFEVAFDVQAIDTTHYYAVAARIMLGEQVLFAAARSPQVLTHGAPDRVEVPLVPASTMGPLPTRAGDIAARLAALQRVDGSWEGDDAASAIAAFFEGGALRYLEERMTIGSEGSVANAYYFEEGALFYLESLRRHGATDAPADTREEVAFRVLFGESGELVESFRWSNGNPTPIDEVELQAALRHAATVRRAAMDLAAGEQ